MTNTLIHLFIFTLAPNAPAPHDTTSPKLLRGHPCPITALAISPDGRVMASGDAYADQPGLVILWDLPSGKKRLTLSGHTDGVLSVAFSPSGKVLASAGDMSVRLWDTVSGRELARLDKMKARPVYVRFLQENLLAVRAPGELPDFLEVGRGLKVVEWNRPKNPPPCSRIEFSADGRLLAICTNDLGAPAQNGEVKLYDVKTGRLTATFPGSNVEIRSLAFSRDGELLALGRADHLIQVWRIAEKESFTLRGHQEEVVALKFSPKGASLASASYGGGVRLWDLRVQKEVAPLRGHPGPVFGLSFTPDGGMLATGGFDRTVKLWPIHRKE